MLVFEFLSYETVNSRTNTKAISADAALKVSTRTMNSWTDAKHLAPPRTISFVTFNQVLMCFHAYTQLLSRLYEYLTLFLELTKHLLFD